MATQTARSRSGRKPACELDEFGGAVDGGLAIVGLDGPLIHMTPSRVAAAMRYFLARVQLHDPNGMPARLALTSALLGEGVTYSTRSLAAVIAYDTDTSVCVVDMNWRRPRPDGAPGGRRGKGNSDGADRVATPPAEGSEAPSSTQVSLADVVEARAVVEDCIIRTKNPRLCLVDAGEVPVARRPALAQGTQLNAVLDEIENQFDYLLFDLPPVLATADAMNLAQLADASVLVVRQGVTPESQVGAALQEMQGGETMGVILNRFRSYVPRRLRRLVGI